MKKPVLLLSTLLSTALAACAGDGAAPGATDLAGGAGPAPTAPAGDEAALAGATDLRPCADRTVANVELPNGDRLALCVLASGNEVVIEQGPIGGQPWLKAPALKSACGLDLFLAATTPDVPVPAALVNACPAEHQVSDAIAARAIVDEPVLQPMRPAVSFRTSYCNVSDQTFVNERCAEMECAPYDDCYDWCVSAHWGWHDRTMSFSNFLGDEGNIAMETNSSCSGSTHVRQWERDDAGDAWGSPDSDYWVSGGHWATSGFIYHSVWLFGQDYDFRLRADSESGAYHQHTGYFLDE
ncbi:MAG TPA: hypothetical protein VHE35_00620 [Kofleriaceae bacterium]|nr:hypothetical protein [Kofleriaceae bacterium]